MVANFLSANFEKLDEIYSASEDFMVYAKLREEFKANKKSGNTAGNKALKLLMLSYKQKINSYLKNFEVSGTL